MTRIKVLIGSFVSMLTFVPALALAQSGLQLGNGNLAGSLDYVWSLVNKLVPILIALGVIVFLWGILKFIFNAGDAEKRSDGKWIIIYSLIGIFVMVSVWGLVAFLQNTFGVSGSGNPTNNGPQLPSPR